MRNFLAFLWIPACRKTLYLASDFRRISPLTEQIMIVKVIRMSIQKAYNDWSETYDTDENLTRDLDQKVTREALANLHFTSILEIGCGTGKNTSFFAQIGTSVYAVDFSEGMIAKAKEKVQAK